MGTLHVNAGSGSSGRGNSLEVLYNVHLHSSCILSLYEYRLDDGSEVVHLGLLEGHYEHLHLWGKWETQFLAHHVFD
jgi:hypothetical protein